MPRMYVVIMAGGGGTRLRPLSTAARPKPFLPLLPTGETLLQRTVARLRGPELDELGANDVFVVAAPGYVPLIEAQLPGARVIVEPEGRNTAAAIALATLAIDRAEDDVMVVLPADHRIEPDDEGQFRGVLASAACGLTGHPFGIDRPLVTLGIRIAFAATQFGYLIPHGGGEQIEGLRAYPVEAFREKPPLEEAERLSRTPGVAWNAGIFLWRRGSILAALEAHAPEVVDPVRRGLVGGDLARLYPTIPSRSIDYAVMEPAARARSVVMGAMAVGWTDIGSWPALLAALGAPGIGGGVVEAGDTLEASDADLVIERGPSGLAVWPATGGTISPERPVALLRGARDALPVVQALLDRCAAAEALA
jgi:mannose-1-phosphate guanylyltransferase